MMKGIDVAKWNGNIDWMLFAGRNILRDICRIMQI